MFVLGSQYAQEDAVEGAHPQSTGIIVAHYLRYARFHLSCSLVGEGEGKYAPWLVTLLHEIGYLVCQHTRLARTCTCYDESRAIAVFDSLTLSRIETVEI